MGTYKMNGRQVSYGSFEELQEVCSTVRKKMFEYITGKIDEQQFFTIYCELEGYLLEHGYTNEEFDYDLPDYEPFLNRAKN